MSLAFILWIMDFVLIATAHSVEQLFSWKLLGLLNDLVFASLIVVGAFPIYMLLYWIKPTLSKIFVSIVYSAYTLFSISLSIYFQLALIPLRIENLKGMSTNQANDIIGIYGFSQWQILFAIPVIAIIVFIVFKVKPIRKPKLVSGFIGLTLILISLNFLSEPHYESDLDGDIKENKVAHFLKSYFQYEENSISFAQDEVSKEIETFYSFNKIIKSEYQDYPLYVEGLPPNSLGDYFVKKDTQPNIVFIIAESLGKQFSGNNARLGSFTPFLDSLANQSLYWENCLANAERTFGAIPNLIGGLPEGDQGFLNLRSAYPDHISLPLILKNHEGYQTNFFCGADENFDFMNEYLMFQKFDGIFGETSFSKNNNMGDLEFEDGHHEAFNWGAEDQVVFKESIDKFSNSPYFNLYLTTSFHGPFAYSNQQYFERLAKERILELHPDENSKYMEELETFSALMYMDFCINQFITEYQKRDDFENTIFVIVGDHSIKFMSDNSRIEKYQVPLIIFSPLLKGSGSFQNVVSHKDVSVSLQSLLVENFGLSLPNYTATLSEGLKTQKAFDCHQNMPLMYADKRLKNYLFEDYFIADDQLYQIILKNRQVSLQAMDDQLKKEELTNRLKNYKFISSYVCYDNKLIPKDVHERYNKKDFVYRFEDDFDQPYTGVSALDVCQNYISNGVFYSDSSAITNGTSPYLNLFDKVPVSVNKENRCRIKLKFKIYSESGNLPSAYFTHFNEDEVKYFEIVHLTNEYGLLKPVDDGWQEFQCSVWMNVEKDRSIDELVSVHLHQPDKSTFYLDDLIFEIQLF